MILAKAEKIRDFEKINFINLTNRQLAEYEMVFRINGGYKIKSIRDFKFKEQLIFQKFINKNQQLNLMLIDSIFPTILADIALMVLLGKVKNLNDYLNSKERNIFPQIINDKIYFERKIIDFMNGLLYGKIGGKSAWNGDTENRRIFCIKNTNEEFDFYSIFERNKLFDFLLSKLQIEVKEIIIGKNKNVCIDLKFKCLN